MSTVKKPILGITMGDPFGNGPEITVRSLADETVYDRCRPLVVGDAASMEYAAAVYNKLTGAAIRVHSVQSVQEAQFVPGTIDVLTLGVVKAEDIPCTADEPKPFGLGATALGGEAAFQYVKRVIELALAGEVDATVTNALSKEAINMAGHHFSGHTEIYAHYTNTDKYTMMLAHEDLRVVHVSTHVSLREACDRVKKPRVLEVIRIADAGCRALGIEKPRVAVAGLNPHCGENGLFGTEEIEEIQPAIDEAMAEGICIPRAPGRTSHTPPQARLQPAARPLCPLGIRYSFRSTRYFDFYQYSRHLRRCQVPAGGWRDQIFTSSYSRLPRPIFSLWIRAASQSVSGWAALKYLVMVAPARSASRTTTLPFSLPRSTRALP